MGNWVLIEGPATFTTGYAAACKKEGASMCKFPYSILIVYYSNLIL